MKTLIDYYDDFAQDWADKWYSNETLLPYLKNFLSILPENPKILDLCCGAGYESMRLKNLGANVVGLDLSEKSIKLAKQKNPNIKFYVKDMLKSFKDVGLFDGVACIAGLVHLAELNLKTAFKNMHEVLQDDGYLFVVVQDGNKIIKRIEIDGQQYAREFYCYTLDKLKEHSEQYFKFEKELNPDGKWRFYIFKKIKG